jgi:hypothetical protein
MDLKQAVASGDPNKVNVVLTAATKGMAPGTRSTEAAVKKMITPEIIAMAKTNDKVRNALVSFSSSYAPASGLTDKLLEDVYKRLDERATYGTGGRKKTRKNKKTRKSRGRRL